MISTFEIFKIIIGIVIAGFFLFFAVKFLGVLAPQQTQNIEIAEMKSLKNIIEKTLVYGVSQNLTVRSEIEYFPPYISRKNNVRIDGSVPFFLNDGNLLYVYPNSLDLGFWKIGWVGALPETKVIYNLLTFSPEAYKIILEITEQFPDSSEPSITFGLCDGETEYTSNTKTNFLKPIRGIVEANQSYQIQGFNYVQCTKQIPNSIKITISDTEIDTDGILVIHENNGGRIKLGVNKTLIYKDGLDIFSVILGGEQIYNYKNEIQFSQLSVFLKKEIERIELLRKIYSNPQYRKPDCIGLLATTKPNLENLKTLVEITTGNDNYNSKDEMDLFAELVSILNENYNQLESKGCS